MAEYTYILIHEDGTIEFVTAFDQSWTESIDAGILEVLRVTDWPDVLDTNGAWQSP